MKCSNCGAELNDDTKFCPECGTDNEAVTEAVENTAEAEQNVEENEEQAENDSQTEDENTAELAEKKAHKVHINAEAYVFFGLAVIVLGIFMYAAYKMGGIGTGMYNMMVEQFGGAESIDADMIKLINLQVSIYSVGAIALRGVGVFFASVLAWLGFRSNNK